MVFRGLGLVLVGAVLGLDQVTKAWARAHLSSPVDLGPMLSLRLGFNPGITFGLLPADGSAARWLLVAMTGVVAIAVLIGMWRTRRGALIAPLALIAGGALGNIVDRVRQGGVTDFIDAHLGDARWPTFNLADVAIVVGVGLLLALLARKPVPTDPHAIQGSERGAVLAPHPDAPHAGVNRRREEPDTSE